MSDTTIGRFIAKVTLGTHKTIEELEAAMRLEGYDISQHAKKMLPKVTVSSELKELELVAVSANDLGFTGRTQRSEIYAKAQSLGLQICPPEVGLQLYRVYFQNEHEYEELMIAMEPATTSDLYIFVFVLNNDNEGLNLQACCSDGWGGAEDGTPSGWGSHNIWVFVRPATTPAAE